jgi:hypothetical protein
MSMYLRVRQMLWSDSRTNVGRTNVGRTKVAASIHKIKLFSCISLYLWVIANRRCLPKKWNVYFKKSYEKSINIILNLRQERKPLVLMSFQCRNVNRHCFITLRYPSFESLGLTNQKELCFFKTLWRFDSTFFPWLHLQKKTFPSQQFN